MQIWSLFYFLFFLGGGILNYTSWSTFQTYVTSIITFDLGVGKTVALRRPIAREIYGINLQLHYVEIVSKFVLGI